MKRFSLLVGLFAAASLQADSDWPQYLPKLEALCGSKFSSDYDIESLKKNNIEIARGQTSGGNECNEPLRYVWYLCESDAGRAVVKKNIRGFRCVGTASSSGDLKLRNGVVTVSRANEERQAFVRSKRQFENLLHVKLKLQSEDPYSDGEWSQLRFKPNPVVDEKTYCTVNGQKVEFDPIVADTFVHRKQTAKVECKFEGEDWTRLQINDGKKTGFSKSRRDNSVRLENFKDGVLDGEEIVSTNGRPTRILFRSQGQVVWTKEFHPSGELASYSVQFKDRMGRIDWNKKGQIMVLECVPQARKDALLRKPCGFDGSSEVQLRDVDGAVASTQVYVDGVVRNQKGGNSEYGIRSDVQFANGKKHGREDVSDSKGRKLGYVHWKNGIKHGEELTYYPELETPKTKENWDEGELTKKTTFYMNGEVNHVESYEGRDRYSQEDFSDDGRRYAIRRYKRCTRKSYWPWCLDGVQESFFSDGVRRAETYKDGNPTSVTQWLADGTVEYQNELMPDGSVKSKKTKKTRK